MTRDGGITAARSGPRRSRPRGDSGSHVKATLAARAGAAEGALVAPGQAAQRSRHRQLQACGTCNRPTCRICVGRATCLSLPRRRAGDQETVARDCFKWGNRGIVATYVYRKPHYSAFKPILECGFDLIQSPLLEARFGKGGVTLCQVDVTPRTAQTRPRRNWWITCWARWSTPPGRRRCPAVSSAIPPACLWPASASCPSRSAPDARGDPRRQ